MCVCERERERERVCVSVQHVAMYVNTFSICRRPIKNRKGVKSSTSDDTTQHTIVM